MAFSLNPKTVYLFLAHAALLSAGVIITPAPLKCIKGDTSRMYEGCLRGQECTIDGRSISHSQDTIYYLIPHRCIPAQKLRDETSSHITNSTKIDVAVREDGRCGKEFENALCDANTGNGGCCSRYGFCGSTINHCLIDRGCQSGCTDSNGFNQIAISKDNVNHKIHNNPSLSSQNQREYSFPVDKSETQDGKCGAEYDHKICGNWPSGNCCSMYGFCGSLSSHCGAGCQSGNCYVVPVKVPDPKPAPLAPNPGSFRVIGMSGVAVMHAGLMPNGKVFFLDKLQNYSQIKTEDGEYAMSAEFDPETRKPIPLSYSTNAFCSGGAFLADGRVISVGGNGPLEFINSKIEDGFTAIRTLARSSTDPYLDGRPWEEPKNRKLVKGRWYPTVQTMPDGSVFVASGSLNGLYPENFENNNPTYEMLDRRGNPRGNIYELDILVKNQPYYMYPFINVLPDGNLFIFVSKQAQVFNHKRNTIIKQLPDLPGDYRTYPNTGGSVLLPLSSSNNWKAEIVICGGGVYQDISSPTDASCGRIAPLDIEPKWEMESMPKGRGMVEGVLLPDGTSIWLNGGNKGAQGFGLMAEPTLEALLYDPDKPVGQRFTTLASSEIPRLYHSCALLLLDGTVLVLGSNPLEMPKLKPDAYDTYVTEYRVEQYTPPYLHGSNAKRRPTDVKLSTKNLTADGSEFHISFYVPADAKSLKVVLYHGGFVTHSIHMGHRMLYLDNNGFKKRSRWQKIEVKGPPNNNVAPPGPYVIYVVVDGIPSVGQFVQVR
ncbi:Aldehyde oxidase GLOX [Erysiphe neolycopersici]|uniref:Aldehyde oxidase GLOX n=1 Tax=Erysiphe neolycopersici TaxID=212602 RepID=A0A420HVC6_9PEZI|nr:Aldehyde oxidase GLOX [Erysiphe neolycopersici]